MPAKFEWVHCNQCLRLTKHDVLIKDVTSEDDELEPEGPVLTWVTTSTLFRCRGCDSVVLRHRLQSDDTGTDDVNYYPPRISRRKPVWISDLPKEFVPLIDEVYTALQAGSLRLALMGARTLIDLFMNATVGDSGNFKIKMQRLVDKGYLSGINKDVIAAALDAGHAAAHRAYCPSSDNVNAVFDIVENLLQSMSFKDKVLRLKSSTPKRKMK